MADVILATASKKWIADCDLSRTEKVLVFKHHGRYADPPRHQRKDLQLTIRSGGSRASFLATVVDQVEYKVMITNDAS